MSDVPPGRTRVACVLAAVIAVAPGCLGVRSAEPWVVPPFEDKPTVVAFIDDGINPYHVDFRRPVVDVRVALANILVDARTNRHPFPLALSLGLEYGEALSRDAPTLENTDLRTLYHIVGTNILAISFEDDPESGITLLDDAGGHGTLVAGVATRTSPDIVVVAVQAGARPCDPQEDGICVMYPPVLAALEWVADQPWIDVLSLSFAEPGNPPEPDANAIAQATRRAAASGKIIVAAGGNSPPPAVANGINGPPWVITVGGAQELDHGAAPLAASYPDVAANYTWSAPSSVSTNDSQNGSGTSLAAPRVAGVLAKAIASVRAEWRHRGGITPDGALAVSPSGERVTAWDFRAALNASARAWNATDWAPQDSPEDPVDALVRATVPVASPAAQVGWGFVDNATAVEVAARVLARDFALPAAKEGAHRAAVEGAFAARAAYWARVE